MPLHCHCERPTGAWQSHFATTRLLRHFIPRNDTLLNAFVLTPEIICGCQPSASIFGYLFCKAFCKFLHPISSPISQAFCKSWLIYNPPFPLQVHSFYNLLTHRLSSNHYIPFSYCLISLNTKIHDWCRLRQDSGLRLLPYCNP